MVAASACMMTIWDVVMDPANSTINGLWKWHDGGSYLGVPPSNFLGWFLEMFIAFGLVAAFLRRREAEFDYSRYDRAFWLVPVLLYLASGLCQIPASIASHGGLVADGSGHLWSTAVVYRITVLVMLCTMAPLSLLAIRRLFTN